ncbi:putative proprotein convertase subtilisin/kexin type 4-like [Scophthalmus maximus]|uniref:Putative proprotein convertase subtilisin/kexin type 4-like n=1 Tax=Scophthalmus maximus TaxID=52904 RepID=A0A2U9AZK1_SCOMX|nr:putative proprotein convertase subtilisin/kexin type 4-like [Scophthalmus maximus]
MYKQAPILNLESILAALLLYWLCTGPNVQGQYSAGGFDLNVMPVWSNNITGHGVVVSIVDDGEFDLHSYAPNSGPSEERVKDLS